MNWNNKKLVEYINYDELREKYSKDWTIGEELPDDLQDKITMNKDLFFSLLWNESSRVAEKLNKDILEVTFADIITYLFSADNLSDVVSVTRLYNIKNNN